MKELFIWNKFQGFTKWWVVFVSRVLRGIPFWVQFSQNWSPVLRIQVKPNLSNKMAERFGEQNIEQNESCL